MNKKFIAPSKRLLISLYVERCLPMHEISKRLNISIGSVFNYIKKYNIETRDHSTTFNFSGRTHSAEAREKISKVHKGKKLSEGTKAKISASHIIGGIGHKKKRPDGYISIYFPEHPQATKDGYILEHDLVAECMIGRWLTKDECVHHKNRIKSDNRKENLIVMTKSEHMSLHAKERWENIRNAQ